MSARFVDAGLVWRAASDAGFRAGRYFVAKPRGGTRWVARRQNARETGPQLWPTPLGEWPTFALAARACEIDAVLERTS